MRLHCVQVRLAIPWIALLAAEVGCSSAPEVPGVKLARFRFPKDSEIHGQAHQRYLFVGGHRVTGHVDASYEAGTLYLAGLPIDPMPPDDFKRWEDARSDSLRLEGRAEVLSDRVPMVSRLIREGRPPIEATSRWEIAKGRMEKALLDSMYARERVGDSLSNLDAARLLNSEIVETNLKSPNAPSFRRLSYTFYVHGVGWEGMHLMDPACLIAEASGYVRPTEADTFAMALERAKTLQEHVDVDGPLVMFVSSSGKLFLHGEKALDAISQIAALGAAERARAERPGAARRVPLGRFLDEIAFVQGRR